MQTSANVSSSSFHFVQKSSNKAEQCNFAFTARSFNLNFNVPRGRLPLNKIIENPILPIFQIDDPIKNIVEKSDIVPDKAIEIPTTTMIIEKQAKLHSKNLILIRRKKMKKHKRRKFLKRMKFVIRKREQRRKIAKEKIFQAELQEIIKAADQFDPKEYVAERLNLLQKERLPNRYRGELLPESMIREFLKKEQEKREHKKRLSSYRIKLDD